MKIQFKDNFWGYFTYYRNIIGNHLFIYLLINVLVGLLDGIGLVLFIPLLTIAGGEAAGGNEATAMGDMKFVVEFISWLGFDLNLYSILAFLVFLFAIKGFIKFFQVKYFAYVRYLFLTRVRESLLSGLQHLTYKGFLRLDAGKIQNNLVNEVTRLFTSMYNYFYSIQNIAMLATYAALAFFANWKFAILVAVGAAISNLIYKQLFKATKKSSVDISLQGNDFNAFLMQAIHHFKYLKSTNYFPRYAEKLKEVIKKTEHLNVRLGHYQAIVEGAREPIIILIIALVIAFQVSVMNSNLGSILISLLFFYRALSYLAVLQTSWQNFIQNIGGMQSVAAIHEEMELHREEIGKVSPPEKIESIDIRNVTIAYSKAVILHDVSLSIGKNTSVAFVGESGSGKTSLVNVLAGLFSPEQGSLFLNGNIDSRDLQISKYREKIGYVSQESAIFNDTIYNNITFWAPKTAENMKRFLTAVRKASLQHVISQLPDREETVLGDNGMMVSGGQKQRIAIAREFFKDIEILILDEATSALDSETELAIKESIDALKGTCTLIIIAHRLSTIRNVDTVYLLGQQKILQKGTYEDLYNASPIFKRMVNLQEI